MLSERNKRWFPVLIACLLLIGISMWVCALIPLPENSDNRAVTNTTHSAYPQLLREWDGRLARFSPHGTVPLEVYEVDILTLPPEEQTRLAQGITIPDADTLTALLEAYTS